MLDKEGHLLDNAFINEAWGKMNQLLDKEMPVKKKRRGAFWWLFPFLLLLALSVINSSEFEPKKEPESLTVLSVNAPDSNEKTFEVKKQTTKSDAKKLSPKREDSLSGISSTPIRQSSSLNSSFTDTENFQNFTSSKNGQTLPELTTDTLATTAPIINSNVSSIEKEENISADNLKETSTKEQSIAPVQQQILLLNSLNIKKTALLDIPEKATTLPQLIKLKKNRWSFGIKGGMIVDNTFLYQGFQAGVWLRRHQLFGRFSFWTGLNFNNYELESQYTQTVQESLESDDPVTFGINKVSETPPPPSFSVSEIELPLQVGWSINRKFTLLAGGWLSYRWVIYNATEQVNFESLSDNENFNLDALFEFEPGESIPSTNLNRMGWGFSSGVHYNLNPKLGLYFQYRRGNALLSNIDLIIPNEQFILGGAFSF